MRRTRLIAFMLLVGTVVALYLALHGLGLLGTSALAEVRPVPSGHQEIAWFQTATSVESWERFLKAVRLVKTERPELNLEIQEGFPDQGDAVPEIALWIKGREDAKLWVRWYKLTSGNDARTWIAKLARRQPAPLAIIGGDTSDRALVMANALKEQRTQWRGADPVFLITTATADNYYKDLVHGLPPSDTDNTKDLLVEVYPGRSFRFCFTNEQMARAVLEFVREQPSIWGPDPAHDAGTAGQAVQGALGCLVYLAVTQLQELSLHALEWRDDQYSRDLANRFCDVFGKRFGPDFTLGPDQFASEVQPVPFSVGDLETPNPGEAIVASLLRARFGDRPDRRKLLVLPTNAQRARRFLRTLSTAHAFRLRNLVVLTGDSISFNTVYRDREINWNLRDVPLPLVFFSHRNPVDRAAGFLPEGSPQPADDDSPAATGTEDLLLYRDIIEALVQTAFQQQTLLANADELVPRLRRTIWWNNRVEVVSDEEVLARADELLFTKKGNRRSGTGEHIVWLEPKLNWALSPQPEATITVWPLSPRNAPSSHSPRYADKLTVTYGSVSLEGGNGHAGN
jgi:hypothetical protein